MLTRQDLSEGQGGAGALPSLNYLLQRTATAWWVNCDGQVYGPYATFPVALAAAIEEAEAAVACGFRSQVFAPGDDSGDHLIWKAGGGIRP